jgi:NAD(P)-dependent dehydrogenase (short-subunit alcohol dehydrogenase family)
VGATLAGKVAIVTGAGRGLGASVARLFAAEEALVVVNDFGVAVDGSSPDESPAAEVVKAIQADGGEAVANSADVGDFAAAEALVQQAVDEFGRLDILVNVAGILRDRMIFNMSEEEWDSVIRVHLKGTFNTCRHASAYFRTQKDTENHFRIINFTSGAGLHGGPTQPNYSAAKLGIVGLTYSCANALGRYGVTANAISPAASTRMTSTIPEGGLGIEDTGDPFMSPDNVAPAVAYLAGDRSDWCTGQVIAVYGKKIVLFKRFDIESVVTSPQPWDIATAADLMEEVIKPATEGRYDPYRQA